MKVGLVLDDSLDPPDGVQQYVLTLGRWLSSHGHTVHYLVGQTERTDIPGIKSLSRNVAVAFNGNRMRIPLPIKRSAIKRLLETEDYDVLHVQMPYSPMLAQPIVQYAPARTVVIGTFHIVAYSRLVSFANRLLAIALRPSLRRFDEVMAVSEPAAKLARSAFGIDSRVIPNMVDISRFQRVPRRPSGPLRIAYLGRLVERKGCRTLLEALQILAKRGDMPEHETIIGGKGPQAATLQAFARQNDLAVTFSGFVSEYDKPQFLADADISVFPSKGGESFGIILVEAMASGNSAVLGGDNAGYRTVLQHEPTSLFQPGNATKLANTLAALLQDGTERRRLAQAQAASAAQYDQDVLGPRILAAYESYLRRRAG